jgi:hypothetical protein
MQIDQRKHKIKAKNRYRDKYPKTQIIIGNSLRKNDYHLVRLMHKDYGETKRWNTFTISREGVVYQHYDPKFYTDYMGKKKIDQQSISIVLENMCALVKTEKGVYNNWLNEVCDESVVENRKFFAHHFWEIFPDKQIESAAILCKNLCEEFDIPKRVIEFHHHNDKIVNFNGIVLVSNFLEDTNNVNPLFDLVKFSELLNK